MYQRRDCARIGWYNGEPHQFQPTPENLGETSVTRRILCFETTSSGEPQSLEAAKPAFRELFFRK
ncbi:MAG TPA: hypothetical protein DDW50_08995 [Firmicutes bacterium]|nr:hypothetical protein [Bacillota bacterium]